MALFKIIRQTLNECDGICSSVLQDLLALELTCSQKNMPLPDRLQVHRKGRPGEQEEEPFAHELRCFPNASGLSQVSNHPWLGHRTGVQ